MRDTAARVNLWAAVAVEFARFEKTERAIEIAQEIPEENAAHRPRCPASRKSASRAAKMIWRNSQSAELTTIRRKLSPCSRSPTRQIRRANLPTRSFFSTNQPPFADTVDRLTARAKAFDQLARRYHAFEDREKMHAMFYESLTTILKIRDGSDRAAALARMSEFYEANHLDLTDTERETMLKIIAKSNS